MTQQPQPQWARQPQRVPQPHTPQHTAPIAYDQTQAHPAQRAGGSMWVEIERNLAEAIEEQILRGESRERIVQRLLLEALRGRAAASIPTARARVDVSGTLKQLLDAGLIAEDDELRYTEVRRGTVHVGRIDADGLIHTDKGVGSSPSTALRQLVNYSMNGWKYWTHVATGKTLAELRAEMGSRQ